MYFLGQICTVMLLLSSRTATGFRDDIYAY